GTGRRFSKNMVIWIRYKYKISSNCPEGRMCRGISGGRTLSFEGRRGVAPGERVDDQCLVPLGCPGRHPGDTPRPLVDQVDAGDHRPVAQAHAPLLDPAFGLMSQTGPKEGPNLLL